MASPPFVIKNDYKEWSKSFDRRSSHQVDYGVWWTPFGIVGARAYRWRVTWFLNTGELVAIENGERGRYIILGVYPLRVDADKVMDRWEYPDSPIYHNLWALMMRIKHLRGSTKGEKEREAIYE